MLEESLRNGALEKALETLTGGIDPELSQAATKIQAVHRGKQGRAELQRGKEEKERKLAEVQWRARTLLEGSLHNGALQQAIEADNAAKPQLQDLRVKARNVLEGALISGELSSVLANTTPKVLMTSGGSVEGCCDLIV